MQRKLFAVLFAAVLLPALLLAQDGKLRGRVTDRDTGEPLVGANVFVEGTNMGAACDINGDYFILSVRPGVYTLRVSYVGYNSVTISNVRVSSNITETKDIKMTSSAIQVQAVEIVAERPIIQRNTTNTVRMTTQEDIENLPIRGVQNILGFAAGVVQQGGNLYVRGGRAGEVAYYVDGANVTNPLFNSEAVSIVQEAVEELQMQAGGYTAEYGGSASGMVRTNVRTGGSTYKASLDYLTDDFAKPGNQFLGTSSFGYRNVVGTFSGPMPGIKNMSIFLAGQNNYNRNRRAMWLTPFEFTLTTDVNDSRGAGKPLPGPVGFKENYLPNNWIFTNTFQGTVQYDLQPLKFRLTGSYNYQENPLRGDWNGALANVFALSRAQIEKRNTMFGSLRITHVVDASTYYEITGSFQSRQYQNFDPTFGNVWQAYMDSASNAQNGYTGFTSRWLGPNGYSVINGFAINNEFTPNNTYQINKQQSWGLAADLTRQMNKNWEVKLGGRFDLWTMRLFSVGSISNYMTYLYGTRGNESRTFANEAERRVLIAKRGTINHYGYTVDGVEAVSGSPDEARKPIFISGYFQNKFEYRDLILSVGLRYEYFNPNHLTFPDALNPPFNTALDVIDESQMVKAAPYQLVLPRISFSFPVTDNTVFYAQYGNYAQMPSLDGIYVGNTTLSRSVSPISRSNAYLTPVGYLATPERTTQYEMGIRQVLSNNFAFTLSGFYKDIKDQLQVRSLLDANGVEVYKAYLNEDFGTVKGIELTLELRRTERFAAKVNYTLSDARGTGSDRQSAFGAVEQNIGRAVSFINPLNFDQTHRGNVMLDYRWGLDEGGPILSGLGANVLLSFNSGHPYTKVQPLKELGQSSPWDVGVEPQNDRRYSYPQEPVNISTTPFVFDVTLQVSKMFAVGPLKMELYVKVLNLLNTKQVINVYPTTGSGQDDGFMSNPLSAGYRAIPNYEAFYRAINLENRWAAFGPIGDLYGTPRQIRVGLRAEI